MSTRVSPQRAVLLRSFTIREPHKRAPSWYVALPARCDGVTALQPSIDEIVGRIDKDELVRLILDICTIDSAGPNEAPVARYVGDWLRAEGFKVRNVGLLPDRFNVLARLPGSGGGYSLILNSHMDTAVRATDVWTHRDPHDAIHHTAWREGDELVGEGVVNDKGPMAAFLIAAKAIKRAGVTLKGDLLLSAAVAETSHEPSDDPPGTLVETQDLGARFLATHGGVADYALVAEGTAFSIVTVEAGMAWYKITWVSDQPSFYTPYLPDRTTMAESPNMIVRAAAGVAALEQWAAAYQKNYTRTLRGGTVIPKAQVGAVRAGHSTGVMMTPQICSLYLCAFIVPGQDPLTLKAEIEHALKAAGVPASEVELYLFRPGYEARNAERLVEAVRRAHLATFGTEPPPPDPATCSMWRDINSYNELGIPAITYGPRSQRHSYRKAITIEAMVQAACVYTRTMVDICSQEKRA
jgi:acetylornithine deacetylase/succinyl-diaminopimelate desuccinylase-like protein